MTIAVVFNGIPEYVTCTDVVLSVEQIFGITDGSFKIRDLRRNRNITNWQFALYFKSVHEASTAQRLLHCCDYVFPNGEAYVLFAKISADPDVLNPEIVRVAKSGSSSYDEDCWDVGGVQKAMAEYRDKPKSLPRAEEEIPREKRKLWREYREMDHRDEHHYSRSTKGKDRSRSRYRSRSRSRHGSRSRSRHGTRSHKWESRKRDTEKSDVKPSTKMDYNSPSCSNYYSSSHKSGESDTDKKPKVTVFNIKIEKNEATKLILKDIDAMLDKICYEKKVNILEKGVNLDIIRRLKDCVKERIESLIINNTMRSSAIVSCYRSIFSKNDDKEIIETILNKYVTANPQIQNKCVDKSIISSESSVNDCNSEDGNMWRDVEEILQDVKIEPLSEDSDEENINIQFRSPKLDQLEEPRVTEVIDVTPEPLMLTENNTQLEMIIVLKNTNKLNVSVNENKKTIKNKKTPTNDSQNDTVQNNTKLINRKDLVFIATKSLMRKMKPTFTKMKSSLSIDVKSFQNTVEKDIKNKIKFLLNDKEYMRTANIIKLFREYYPKENEKEFLECVAEGLKRGKV